MLKKRSRSVILFQSVLKSSKGFALAAICLKIINGVMPILYITVYSYFIEKLLQSYSYGVSTGKMILVVMSFVIVGILNFFSSGIATYITTRLQHCMQKKLCLDNIEKISRLEYTHIENSESYDSIARVRKETPEILLDGFFAYLGLGELTLKICSIAGMILFFSPWMSVLMLVCCIPVVWISLRSGKEDYEAFIAYQKIERRIDDYETVLTDKKYVKERMIYGYSEWFSKRWNEKYREGTEIFLGVKKKMYIQVKLTSGIVLLSFLIMIGGIAYETLKGAVPLGTFTSVTNELLIMSSAISWTLASLIHTISKCHAFVGDYEAFINLSEKTEVSKEVDNKQKIESIEFQNVCFCYPGSEKEILQNLSFLLKAPNTYALVGENGAGKTTITKLLLGLYTNYTGKILINGLDLLEHPELSQLFSVSFQDFGKYEISIRDNIIFGNKEKMSDEKIGELLKVLSFNRNSQEEGLDIEIGYLTEKTTNLSLGEWQKISLIRALASKGTFYLLDEPTASLDPSAEAAIYNDFIKIVDENPALIITHRLGAARLADKIIVLEHGTVNEMGSHEELLRQKGTYSKMYEAQKGWYV